MANPNIVQSVQKGLAANAASITITFAPTQAGNTLVALLNYGSNTAVTAPPNWTLITSVANGTSQTLGIYWYRNCSAGITAQTFSFTSNGASIAGYELTPVDIYILQDKFASSSGSSTAGVTGTTAATTHPNEICIGAIGGNSGGALTLSAILNGFTLDQSVACSGATNNPHVFALSNTVSATGTQSSGGTISSSVAWTGLIATFVLVIPPQMFTPSPGQTLLFAEEAGASTQKTGAVNVSMSLATAEEAGGQFIGPSAHVLQIAETGQSQRIGAVNVSMSVATSEEAGGQFIGPAAQTRAFAIDAARVVLPGAVNAAMSVATTEEAGGQFLGPAAQVQQFAIEAARVVLPGSVNVGLSLATSETPGGMFIGPSASVLGIAELGQPTAGGPMNGAVNVGMGLSAKNEAGGQFIGPAAQVLSIAETGQSQRIGAVNVSLSLAASEEAGGMFVGPAAQTQAFAIEAARSILAGSVNVQTSLSVFDQAGGMFIGPSAGVLGIAKMAIVPPAPPSILITPVGTIAAGITPTGSAAAGIVPSGSVVAGVLPSGTIAAGTTPGGTIAGPNEPTGSIVRD